MFLFFGSNSKFLVTVHQQLASFYRNFICFVFSFFLSIKFWMNANHSSWISYRNPQHTHKDTVQQDVHLCMAAIKYWICSPLMYRLSGMTLLIDSWTTWRLNRAIWAPSPLNGVHGRVCDYLGQTHSVTMYGYKFMYHFHWESDRPVQCRCCANSHHCNGAMDFR